MNRDGGRPVRIAHAYGNRREKIEAALAADIDFIEADIWHRGGEIWVRHERRLGLIPLLYDRKPPGVDGFGPWALTLFLGYYVRLDVNPLTLAELLERTAGTRRLLLDVKDKVAGEEGRAYARTLARTLSQAECEGSVIICGQTDVLDDIRQVGPELDVRYSIAGQPQWEAFLRRLDADPELRGVCMLHEFLSEPIARLLEERGLQVFCWTVDDPKDVGRLVGLGIDGIISNSIPLLEGLKGA